MARNGLVLGTAGHIDHGKSSLVKALTGTDPDRLVEEKKRGITIELGFANLVLPGGEAVGVVDVPGHERFVRQMIAGASGVDFALLCIAADDGVMPQTEEHIAVLQLLGVQTCVVALTKADLVDEEWLLMMEDEVRQFLDATPFQGAPVVAVSSKSGVGLDELRVALADAAATVSRAQRSDHARMPIDRVFTIKGSGTVVTGTLWSGEISVGETVRILPSGAEARVRGVQIHDAPCETASAGHRVALNFSNLATSDLAPGDFVTARAQDAVTYRFDALFESHPLGTAKRRPLKSGTRVHVAHGAREVVGRLIFLEGRDALEPGRSSLAQVRLDEPLPVREGDRFVVRSYSPVQVIGGGSVLLAHPRHSSRTSEADAALLHALAEGRGGDALKAALGQRGVLMTASQLADYIGADESRVRDDLDRLVADGAVVALGAGSSALCGERGTLTRLEMSVRSWLERFHATHPDDRGASKKALHQGCVLKMGDGAFETFLGYLAERGDVVVAEGLVAHPASAGAALAAEREAADAMVAVLAEAGGAPPAVSQLLDQLGMSPSLGHRVVGLLEKEGRVCRLDADHVIETGALAAMERLIVETMRAGHTSTPELRDAMGVSRRYAMLILENLDDRGITEREGDGRVLRE